MPSDPRFDQLALLLRKRAGPQAVALAEALVADHPDSPIAWSGLADAWAVGGPAANALQARKQALRLQPDNLTLQYNLGTALLSAGNQSDAVVVLERLTKHAPRQPMPRMNLGIALRDLGQLPRAAHELLHALRLTPNASTAAAEVEWNLALVWLMGGNLAQGLRAYEARRRLPRFSMLLPKGLPAWRGEPSQTGLLIVVEQGLGDTLQYTRWVRRLREHVSGRIVVGVQKPLVKLLTTGLDGLGPDDEVVALSKHMAVSGVRAWAPLLSLPFLLNASDRATHMESKGWLSADPSLRDTWRQRLASLPGLKVGIVWQGNPGYKDDHNRSWPLNALAPLAAVEGVTLVSLQKRHGRGQLASAGFEVVDFDSDLDETTGPFLDTAALMQELDLVVTSDTATLHLAGALGVRTWAAIAHIPDWRFGLQGDQLPEYPTVRLVRQASPGDWDSVAQRMASWLIRERFDTA